MLYLCNMNELAIHIEYLLLHSDCVIVPHLGGFMTQVEDAKLLEAEELFLPPVRIVRFNANLQKDDSQLFVRSLCQIEGISENEAMARCVAYASELNEALATEGSVDFGSMGIFTREGGKLCFSPCEAGCTTPDLYGLDTFHMAKLESEQMMPEEKVVAISSIKADAKHITIRINRRLANYVATTAAAIVMCVMFNTTIPTSTPSQQTAAFAVPQVSVAPKAEATAPKAVVVAPSTPKQETAKKEETKKEAPKHETKSTAPTCKYAVLLTAKKHADEVESRLKRMHRKGIKEAEIITHEGTRYVAIMGYNDYDKARNRQLEIKKELKVHGTSVLEF